MGKVAQWQIRRTSVLQDIITLSGAGVGDTNSGVGYADVISAVAIFGGGRVEQFSELDREFNNLPVRHRFPGSARGYPWFARMLAVL